MSDKTIIENIGLGNVSNKKEIYAVTKKSAVGRMKFQISKASMQGGTIGVISASAITEGSRLNWGKSKGEVVTEPVCPEPPVDPTIPEIEVVIYDRAPIANSVTEEMSFNEAFGAARREIGGGGGFFKWKGKLYNTYYKEEWDVMDLEDKVGYWASMDVIESDMDSVNEGVVIEDMIEETQEPDEMDYENTIEAGVDRPEMELNLENETYATFPIDTDNNGKVDVMHINLDEDEIVEAIMIDRDQDGIPDEILYDTDNNNSFDLQATLDASGQPINPVVLEHPIEAPIMGEVVEEKENYEYEEEDDDFSDDFEEEIDGMDNSFDDNGFM